jgi:hypothetical protein
VKAKLFTIKKWRDPETGTVSDTRIWIFGEDIKRYEETGVWDDKFDYGIDGEEISRLSEASFNKRLKKQQRRQINKSLAEE